MVYPLAQQEYMYHMMLYNKAPDEATKKRNGDMIFNLIMPIAHKYDPVLMRLIPEKTLQ